MIPEQWHGKKVVALIAASTGPVDEGDALVRALRRVAEPIADLLGPMPYHVIQTLIDPLWPKGIHAYFKATNLARLDDELVDRLCAIHLAAPGPQCEIHVHQMGGAVGRVADGATAFAERSMPFVLNAVTGWHDPDMGTAHTEWARTAVAAASDASTGRAYVNFLGDPDAARTAYGEETYRPARLAQGPVRPHERVPAQPEHPADRLLTNGAAGGTPPSSARASPTTGNFGPADRTTAEAQSEPAAAALARARDALLGNSNHHKDVTRRKGGLK